MRTITAAALLAAACLLSLPAAAQDKLDDTGRCLPHTDLVDYLARAFDENRVATAALDDGLPAELYVSRRGTWTLVEVHADGLGCIKAYGERMQFEREVGQTALHHAAG